MNQEEHKKRHELLHSMLNEIMTDYELHNKGQRPSSTYVMHLKLWSFKQTLKPTEHEEMLHDKSE